MLQLASQRGRTFGFLVLAVVAAVAGLGTYAISSSVAAGHPDAAMRAKAGTRPAASHRPRRQPATRSTPTEAEFARTFVSLSNAYAESHNESTRFANADCVQASAGHYMCSYTVERPGRPSECHLMQARWTPDRASTFTVTLAGRTRKCGTLREAIASLD
jgi:hypothetical protein